MQLLDLPTELLLLIAESLGPRDFTSLLTLNHRSTYLPCDRGLETAVLHTAAWNGREDVVRVLVEKGADVNMLDTYGRAALHLAVMKGHEGVVRVLLERGASGGIRDRYGKVPEEWAVRFGYEGIGRMLKEPRLDAVRVGGKEERGWRCLVGVRIGMGLW